MGTRSVVAVPQGDSFRGRYIHWDGYPTGVGANLLAILRRDGVEKTIATLTADHYGWSSLNCTTTEDAELSPGMNDGRFTVVPGYGTGYTTKDGQSSPDEWIEGTGDNWGTEWAYVISSTKVQVLTSTVDGWRHVGELDIATATDDQLETIEKEN